MGILRSVIVNKRSSSPNSKPFKPSMLEKLEPRILLSGDALFYAAEPGELLDNTQPVVQYVDLQQTTEQIEGQVSSDSSEADLYEPILTLSVKDNDSEVENISDEDVVNKIELTQVAQTCLSSETTINPAFPTEDGGMPIETNDVDLSIEYATSIEIRGPPGYDIESLATFDLDAYAITDGFTETSNTEGVFASRAPDLPGLELVDPDINSWEGQVIYLDFDGEQGVIYNGPILIGPFDIPAFAATDIFAEHEGSVISDVLKELNQIFAGSGVVFTIDQPTVDQAYSTVYIGGDDSAFADYGSFSGLAEQVDVGNKDRCDEAFVFSDGLSVQQIVSVISHEVGHLLGYRHDRQIAGTEGVSLTDVAVVTFTVDQTVLELPEDTDTTSRINVAEIDVIGEDLNVLSLGGDDAALFEIDPVSVNGSGNSILYLKAGAVLDFETNPVLDVTINIDDSYPEISPDDTTDLSITITDANDAPVADAGDDQTIIDANCIGTEYVSLDGSGSNDPDGTIVSYVWTESGTEIATGETPTVILAVGEHTITLTVTDNEGRIDQDDVVLTIQAVPLIIDHTCTDLAQIPLSAIEQAKETLHIEYGHTSHGFQVTAGMKDLVEFINNGGLGLEYPEDTFAFNADGSDGALNLPMNSVFWEMGVYDLGRPDRYAWEAATREYLDAHPEVNVIMWAWCGQHSTTIENIDIYLSLMEGLIADYPDVHFVFMTGHLDGQGTDWLVYQANEHIRQHCIENNRILYDFADIESYDPDGLVNYMPLRADANCDYDSDGDGILDSNWAIDWQDSHTEGVDWYESPDFDTGVPTHTQSLNVNLKAYAAWWLWATLAGWNQGNTYPVLVTNAGVTVPEGGTETIDNTELQVTDADNLPAELQFTLTAVPTNGLLKLDGTTLVIDDTFTQEDIDNNLLTYEHDGGEAVSDSFEFTVYDGSGGSIGNTTFSITVTPINDDPVLAVNNGIAVPDGGTRIIDNTKLQVTDADNTSDELQFTLTEVPTAGLLKLDDTTLAVDDTFTQADIDSNLLIHEDNGSQTVSDGFQFTVSDGSGGSIGNTTFNIIIATVNEPPTIELINTTTILLENTDTTNRIKVADIVVSDEGLGTNVLSLSGADASLFHIDGTELYLNAGVTLEQRVGLEVYLNDPSCAAYWQFEDGALGSDSVGTNNLYVFGPEANTSDFIEGGASAEFSGSADRLHCLDSDLDLGFPMKSDGINKDITTIQWIKFTQLGPTVNEFWGKYKDGNVVYRLSAYADGRVRISSGYEGGFLHQEGDFYSATVQTNRWYFIASTYQSSDRSYRLRIYDYAADDFLAEDLTGNFDHDINVGDPGDGFFVLSYASPTFSFKGLMDACIVFNRALSVEELEDIRLGMFGEAVGDAALDVTVEVDDPTVADTPDDTASLSISIGPPNDPPTLEPIGDKTVDEGDLLSFTAIATDSDIPENILTFSFIDAPSGAAIDPATGVFAWTPTEEQGPDSYLVTIRVTDDGTLNLYDQETIIITVNEMNNAPVLVAIGDKTIDECCLTAFTVVATDSDIPANLLTFSLLDAPSGAFIDPVTGLFTWNPGEEQGPDSYLVTIRVTDDGTPNLYDEETITITLTEVNDAPVLEAIGDKTIDEGDLLGFTAVATDSDIPVNVLTFSLIDAPSGAVIDPATGELTWTPSEGQGPDSYLVTVRVTDDGTPNLYDQETITITVNETNTAPVLAPIGDQTAHQDSLLSFTVAATDSDIPANVLMFSLIDAPNGADIDPTTGEFTWTPRHNQGPDDFLVTIRVTDDGTPNLYDEETITITVKEPNNDPVLATNTGATVPEGGTGIIDNTQLQVTDVDNLPAELKFTLTAEPTNGFLKLDGTTLYLSNTFTQADIDSNLLTYEHNGSETVADSFEFTVSDGSGGSIGNTTFIITVTPVNDEPVLATIGDKTIDEGDLLSFTAVATDSDIPANTLTFSLIDAPAGASIDPVTGEFTWIPSEEQGPDSYLVTVRVTDDGTPNLYDEEVITITVNETNAAPVLAAIGDQLADEESLLSFTAIATDGDIPANALTFSLIDAPSGAAIDPVTGVFTWTPSEEQGPDSYSVTVRVTDNGIPNLYDEETITITVNEVNANPVVDTNTGIIVLEGSTGTIDNTKLQVTDIDNTPAELQFTLTAVPTNGLLKLDGTTLAVDDTFTQTDIDGNLLTYEHDGSQTDSDSFQFTVSDGNGGSIGNTTFDITITNINDPPTVTLINTITILPENTDTTNPVKVADIVVTDDGFGTNVLSLSGADASLFHINGTELFLNAGVTLERGVDLGVYLNDPSCVAYWQFEQGALGSDSVGTNDLNVTGAEANTNDVIEGQASAEFSGTADRLNCLDSELDPGFPMKSDGINKDITTIQWIKFSELGPIVNVLWAKYKAGNVVYRLLAYPDGRIQISSGYEGGYLSQEHDSFGTPVQTDRWYFIASTYQSSDHSYRVQIYDYAAGDFLDEDLTGNFDHDIDVGNVGDGFFTLSYASSTFSFKGLMDACIVFNRALSVEELDDIRLGMLGEGNATLEVNVEVDDMTIGGTPDDMASLAISITAPNNPPVLEPIGDKAVDEGDLLSFTAVATDSDTPANVLTYSLINAPSSAVIDPVTGIFTWTPSEEQGPDSYVVTFRVTDDGIPNLYDEETITITVNEANIDPVLATNTGATVPEGGTETIDNTKLQITDVDNTPAELQFTLTATPTNGLLKLNGTTLSAGNTFTQVDIDSNLLTYEHDGGEAVSDSFEFTVSDGSGGSISNTMFSITVTPVNDAPVLTANNGVMVPDGGTEIIDNTELQVTDVDNTPAQLQFTLTATPTNGLLKLDGLTLSVDSTFTQEDINSNLLTYEHDGGDTVSDSFQFTASDGSGGSIPDTTFNITITEVNEPPTVELTNTITALPENTDTTNPTKVADIVVTDDSIGTNILSLSGADASMFHIDGTELFLNAGVTLEHEVNLEAYLNDPSCVAYWQFEEGALGADSVGTNDLYVFGPEANTYDFIEGGASAEFSGSADRFMCLDNELDPGFPMKGDGINKDITTIQWIKFTQLGPTVNEFWGKYKDGNVVYRLSAYADGRVRISSGYEGGFINQEGDFYSATVQTNRWYFIASTYRASDRSYRLRIYDYAAGDFLAEDLTGNFDHDINVGDPGDGFFVLSYASPTFSFKGLMDACIVFNRALSVQELEDIRLGMFGEGQGNATLEVNVEVDDPMIVGTPDDTASLSITITTDEANTAPVLEPIADKTVDEGGLLSFTAVATDSDIPADILTYSLIDAPTGAAIDPVTGVFTWTPGEEQGPDNYPVTVRVTDNGTPNLYDQETIIITVNETNAAPVLAAIVDQVVDEGNLLTFTAVATDIDIPENVLTFSLVDAPSGAAIDAVTGVFTWTPGEEQGPDSYLVTVRITDNGTPNLYDEETITITVNQPW